MHIEVYDFRTPIWKYDFGDLHLLLKLKPHLSKNPVGYKWEIGNVISY